MALQLSPTLDRKTAAAIDSVISAYDTENLRAALKAYPARIKAQRDAVNIARKAWKDAELERATLEAELVLAISIETDDKGKTKFSNAEARAAELLRRKAADPRYIAAAEAVADAEEQATEAQDALQMLLDEYQSARIAARLIAAEMSVLSELIDVGEREEISAEGAIQVEIPALSQGSAPSKVVPIPKSKEAF